MVGASQVWNRSDQHGLEGADGVDQRCHWQPGVHQPLVEGNTCITRSFSSISTPKTARTKLAVSGLQMGARLLVAHRLEAEQLVAGWKRREARSPPDPAKDGDLGVGDPLLVRWKLSECEAAVPNC